METNFMKLTKRGNSKCIIIRKCDVLNVSEEDEYCIIKYMLNGNMMLEHVKETITEIYAMLMTDDAIDTNKKHLNS